MRGTSSAGTDCVLHGQRARRLRVPWLPCTNFIDARLRMGMDSTDTNTNDQPTCGQGLAANAVLPAKLAELLAARAEVLERHTQAVDLSDPNGQEERKAYTALSRAHRASAAELTKLAQQMAGCRDLPMARHDLTVMANPEGQMEAFRRFVAIEREVLALLQARLEEEQKLLP
jgi:hypothetical protein